MSKYAHHYQVFNCKTLFQARAMTCDELKAPEMSVTIARKLAKVHTLNVPINKEPKWLFDKIQS